MLILKIDVGDDMCMSEHHAFHRISDPTSGHFLALSQLTVTPFVLVEETNGLNGLSLRNEHSDTQSFLPERFSSRYDWKCPPPLSDFVATERYNVLS